MGAPVISGHGLAVTMPPGWEGRIYRRASGVVAGPGPIRRHSTAGAGTATSEAGDADVVTETEPTNPVVHLANFALPAQRGDYGSGAVDVMGERGVLVVLFEFGPESAHTPLFAHRRPTPRPPEFRTDMLQRVIPGQVGWQRFFTEADRAFSLYVVLGSRRQVPALCAQSRAAVEAIRIGAR